MIFFNNMHKVIESLDMANALHHHLQILNLQNRIDLCNIGGRIFDNIEQLNAYHRIDHNESNQLPAGEI
jgi:hypothetical protein